jgi:integrase
MDSNACNVSRLQPWNKGKLLGQKAPVKLKEIWAIRVRLQLGERLRELAMFNLAIDSKLRSCDLVKLRFRDVCHGDRIATRAIVMQQKTQRPVQFEITEQTRESVVAWIRQAGLRSEGARTTSPRHASCSIRRRACARSIQRPLPPRAAHPSRPSSADTAALRCSSSRLSHVHRPSVGHQAPALTMSNRQCSRATSQPALYRLALAQTPVARHWESPLIMLIVADRLHPLRSVFPRPGIITAVVSVVLAVAASAANFQIPIAHRIR